MSETDDRQTPRDGASRSNTRPESQTNGHDPLSVAAPAQFRMVLVSFSGGGIGLVAGVVAFALYKLIGLFTNLFFYHRFVADFISARHNQLGPWVIVMPVDRRNHRRIHGEIRAPTRSRATAFPRRWKRC